jgi:hypothetical protein
MLLAFAAKPEELEILLISVTYGNVEVQRYITSIPRIEVLADTPPSCLRNVVALFHVIEKEREWRKARGQLEGFEAMLSSKPIVAVGADHPLEDEILMADHFRKSSSFENDMY